MTRLFEEDGAKRSMEPTNLLVVNHLTMAFDDLLALDDVSLQVRAGSMYVVLGEDGAGKTTLMKILSGAIAAGAYSGEVLLEGQPLVLHSLGDGLHHGVTIVPRKIGVFDRMTVADNVMMARWQHDHRFMSSRKATETKAEEVLARLGLAIELGDKVVGMSAVQQRQLMIARALAVDPKLVLLDEPLTGIAGHHAASQLLRTVRRIAELGITCIYLARRTAEALQVADFITVLRDGAVAGAWARPDWDEAAMVSAMASRRLGDAPRTRSDDDFAEPPGPLGSLRSAFDKWWRPGA